MIEEDKPKSETYKPYFDKHDYGNSERRMKEQEEGKHDFTAMMNISNDSWQKGDFFELDKTRTLI